MNRLFKYTFLLMLLGAFFTVGCEDLETEDTLTSDYISFSMNGQDYNVNKGLKGQATNNDGSVSVDLDGKPVIALEKEENKIGGAIIASLEEIAVAGKVGKDLFQNDKLLVFFFSKENGKALLLPLFIMGKSFQNVAEDQSEFSCQLKKDGDYYEGTFSLKVALKNEADEVIETVELTNGKFKIKTNENLVKVMK